MSNENFVLEMIQHRFSKEEIKDMGIDLHLVKSMKVLIKRQASDSYLPNENIRVLLSVTPAGKNIGFGFGDKTRWFKTKFTNGNLDDFHKKFFKATASTNLYIKYTTRIIKEKAAAMENIDQLALKLYNKTVDVG